MCWPYRTVSPSFTAGSELEGRDKEGQGAPKEEPHLPTTDYAVAGTEHVLNSMYIALDVATLPAHAMWPTNLPITNTFLEQGSKRCEQDS